MYRFAFIGLGWGTPCLPFFSLSSGFLLFKPKTVVCLSNPRSGRVLI